MRFLAAQLQRYFASLQAHGSTAPLREQMFDFDQLNSLIGRPELIAQGQRYAGDNGLLSNQ